MLAIDIETFDPNLHTLGDGSIRHDGEILCVGIYDGTAFNWYGPEDLELRDRLSSDEPKIFHNGIYDLSWLVCGYNMKVNGIIHDTMTRMTFIDEYADLDLDSCCKYFKLSGKNKNDTIEAWYNTHAKANGWKGNLWKHAKDIWWNVEGRAQMIKYNKQDCIATYNLFNAQEPYMQKFEEPYNVECNLYPLIIQMKKVGVRIDEDKLNELREKISSDLQQAEEQFYKEYGLTSSVIASPKQLTTALNNLGIHSPIKTAKGAESWTADALDRIQHPIVDLIKAIKNYNSLLNKYLEGALAKSIVNGRIHCTFSPNKREDGGTITGRFASSKPNLQNIPARDEKHGQKTYGQEMRSLFLPEHGCMIGAFDYSQIEYLLLAHYAVGVQAEWFRAQANAGVDFHSVAQTATGIPSRDIVKRLNYGIIYGMGVKKMTNINITLFEKLAAAEGLDVDTFANNTFNQYHARLPVIKDTMQHIQNVAKMQGYVIGLGGRWHRKPRVKYDPATGKLNDFLYKMTNYLIQGSAAEVLKNGMYEALKAGVFNVLTPHLTVHDEIVVSIPYNKEGTEAAMELQSIMNNSFKDRLLVPMKSCAEVGPNWGYWSDDIWEEMKQGIYTRGGI